MQAETIFIQRVLQRPVSPIDIRKSAGLGLALSAAHQSALSFTRLIVQHVNPCLQTKAEGISKMIPFERNDGRTRPVDSLNVNLLC